MKCEYCGKDDQAGKTCGSCGAKLPEPTQNNEWKSEPFFYNGYICYCLRNRMDLTREVQFWLGRELIERIVVLDEVLEGHVRPWEDGMSFFWELFLLARGEKEVLTYQEKNNKYPAMFEVRRIENPERARLRSLSMADLAKESVVR